MSKQLLSILEDRGGQTFSVKSQRVNTLDLAVQTGSLQRVESATKAARDNVYVCVWLSSRKALSGRRNGKCASFAHVTNSSFNFFQPFKNVNTTFSSQPP